MTTLRVCSNCAARTTGVPNKTLGLVCTLCWHPFAKPRKKKPKKKREPAPRHTPQNEAFVTSHAGYPLGRGYPSGEPLREDGESHRAAWYRLLRADPCSYCAKDAGTIDHIDPQSGPRPLYGIHSWLNVTGACSSCNRSKDATKLVLWLAVRPIPAPRVRDE